MKFRRHMLQLGVVLIWICVLALGSPALAQGTTPIQLGQNATGTLSAEANTAQFALTVNAGDSAMIQVLAISAGFVPNFRVLNPAGVEVLNVPNAEGKATLIGNAAFNDAGIYTIMIGGENGSTGQFVLSLQAGVPLPAPTTLTLDQPVAGTVGSQTPIQLYRFNTTSLGAVAVVVQSQTPGIGALVTLYDERAGKSIASSDAGVIGVTYQLPASEKVYRVEVRASVSTDTVFTICIGTCGANLLGGNAPSPTPNGAIPPAQTPEVAAGVCNATSSAGGTVNLRSGPGTQYAVLARLPLGQVIPVLGQWTGGGWYEVNLNGNVLWVGGSVASLSGDCGALPRIAAPPNAPLAPTAVPTNPPPPVNTPEVDSNNTDNSQKPLPNLTTINVQVSNPGDGTLNIDVTVYNSGTVPVDKPYAVKTCIDNTNCDEITGFSEGLQPGESMSFTDGIPFTPNGSNHTVTVTVDSQHEVTESNESDNDGFASFNL